MYPPCVSMVHLLKEAGARITVIAGACPEPIAAGFRRANIDLQIIGNNRNLPGAPGNVLSYTAFRTKAVRAAGPQLDEANTAAWFGTADTAMALWGAFPRSPRAASILELYDKHATHLASLKRILPDFDVVVACEQNRAEIMQSWFHLDRQPLVVANKPHNHPGKSRMPSTSDSTAEAIAKVAHSRALLYQGNISSDRSLAPVAAALSRMNDARWGLYLMGPIHGDALSTVQRAYDQTVYLGNHTPPAHLEVTSYAHIGIAYYDRSSLNNIFCAPNKIYEYAGFGIPVLANDVAGLRYTVGASKAGVSVDFRDPGAIVDGIQAIDGEYHLYSKRARAFFDDADTLSVAQLALERLVDSPKGG